MIFNTVIVLVFSLTCLCDVLKVFGTHENLYAQLLYIGPLYLTCIVFNIALCKIKSSIKAITIAHLHQKMMFIHFFNIITYTMLATADKALHFIKARYDLEGNPDMCYLGGNPDEVLKHYKYGDSEAVIILTMNLFQLYMDSFVLFLILNFTKERANRME